MPFIPYFQPPAIIVQVAQHSAPSHAFAFRPHDVIEGPDGFRRRPLDVIEGPDAHRGRPSDVIEGPDGRRRPADVIEGPDAHSPISIEGLRTRD